VSETAKPPADVAGERAQPPQAETLEEIDNPIERLKLLGEDEEAIGKYLDAIEVTSPREREMLHEISRTRPLARLDRFPEAHRNMVEALESLARHGYHGTAAGRRMGRFRPIVRRAVTLVARYVVVSYVKEISNELRNLYTLREIQAVPGTDERWELRRARTDAERMVEALKRRQLGLPTVLIGGALVPLFATLGRVTGLLGSTAWAAALAGVGVVIALAASWVILRGAALASRRIRLATRGPAQTLWGTIGWCGRPPRDQSRTFVIISVALTLGAWILVPLLVGIALAT
jgi:hypothetical protein